MNQFNRLNLNEVIDCIIVKWPICIDNRLQNDSLNRTALNLSRFKIKWFKIARHQKHSSYVAKNYYFSMFIIMSISLPHALLKDYIHMHQMGSHFVDGWWLNFSVTEQETKNSILQSFGSHWSAIACRRNKVKVPNLNVSSVCWKH